MILLSPEQMKEARRVYHHDGRWTERWGSSRDIAIAKAQAKEIVKWGIEPCLEHVSGGGVFTRRECPLCWQELERELEE